MTSSFSNQNPFVVPLQSYVPLRVPWGSVFCSTPEWTVGVAVRRLKGDKELPVDPPHGGLSHHMRDSENRARDRWGLLKDCRG